MAELSTLVEDIYKLFDGADLETAIEKFKDDIGRMLVQRFSEHGKERKATLRMSNVGRPLRQLYYELNGYKGEPLSSEAKFKFAYGDLIEVLILFLAEAAGHKVERMQETVEVDGIIGHIDAVIDGVLVDVKSCSSRSFEKFQSGSLFEDDPFGYTGQLSGYANATGLEAGFLAVDKVLGKICFLSLPQDLIKKYDIKKRIKTVKETLNSGVLPDKCYEDVPFQKSGNMKLSVGCSYCNWKEECHKDANNGEGLRKYMYSTGPVWLTKVVKEPRVNTWEQFNKKEEE